MKIKEAFREMSSKEGMDDSLSANTGEKVVVMLQNRTQNPQNREKNPTVYQGELSDNSSSR